MKRWLWLTAGVAVGVLTIGLALPAAFASGTPSYGFMGQMMQRVTTTPEGQNMIQQCTGYMSQFGQSESPAGTK